MQKRKRGVGGRVAVVREGGLGGGDGSGGDAALPLRRHELS